MVLNVAPLTVHLSTESLKPLLVFFHSYTLKQNETSLDAAEKLEDTQLFTVEDYQRIMDCIDFNKRVPNEAQEKR